MDKVSDIDKILERDVVSIESHRFVRDALKLMAEQEIGCVLVMEEDRLIGVLSERDYARKVVLKGLSSLDTPVTAIMNTEFPVVEVDTPISYCMELLTNFEVRYLPILDGSKVIGLVSTHDILNTLVIEQSNRIELLNEYLFHYR